MTEQADAAQGSESHQPEAVHAGVPALTAARQQGADVMFTLSGGHIFPMLDAAVHADPPMQILDVRHEQTAAFAAEAIGKLTRTPGFAVLTAGPGVTNGVSAITQANFAGSPMVVLGGRAPAGRWGTGALQELDQPPILAPVTKAANTIATADEVGQGVADAFGLANSAHRGPVFVDVPMDALFDQTTQTAPTVVSPTVLEPNPDDIAAVATLLAQASQPVLILGTDVWADGAEEAALRLVDELGVPTIPNGMGRGVIPGGHPLLVTKARSAALNNADVVVVVGTPLDFRLGYGIFGGKDGAMPATVAHVVDSPGQLATHVNLGASAIGDIAAILDGVTEMATSHPQRQNWAAWAASLREQVQVVAANEATLLSSDSDPIHPARIYGELIPKLADDAVVIGDGGDFVSFAGKFLEPQRPGCWLDPGPYGCLGAGLGAAIAARLSRPSAQVVVLFGDGAAGMSLIDVDTLVRHHLPVVMICGNNSAWGLEKGPMQLLYGYDVAADLAHQTRYDEIVRALGGAGETVKVPSQIGPAIDRAFASGVPYLVNVITDVNATYPRQTLGM